MNKFNINQWLDQTVSHATLNPDHLIPVFKGADFGFWKYDEEQS